MNKSKANLQNVVQIMKVVVNAMEKENPKGSPKGQSLPGPDIIKKLLKRGFSAEDIDTAMRWLTLIHFTASPSSEVPSASSLSEASRPATGKRHLHASESLRLAPEAQALLVTLLEKGSISPVELERTLQYLWQNDLREVSPLRLEMILDMLNPSPQPNSDGHDFSLSGEVPPAAYIN